LRRPTHRPAPAPPASNARVPRAECRIRHWRTRVSSPHRGAARVRLLAPLVTEFFCASDGKLNCKGANRKRQKVVTRTDFASVPRAIASGSWFASVPRAIASGSGGSFKTHLIPSQSLRVLTTHELPDPARGSVTMPFVY